MSAINVVRVETDDTVWEVFPKTQVIRVFPKVPHPWDMKPCGQVTFSEFIEYCKKRKIGST